MEGGVIPFLLFYFLFFFVMSILAFIGNFKNMEICRVEHKNFLCCTLDTNLQVIHIVSCMKFLLPSEIINTLLIIFCIFAGYTYRVLQFCKADYPSGWFFSAICVKKHLTFPYIGRYKCPDTDILPVYIWSYGGLAYQIRDMQWA